MVSKQPRKQRKARGTAPLHVKQKYMKAPLSQDLRSKYGRNATVAVGDTVQIMRGDHAGTKGLVEGASLKSGMIVIEGVYVTKADGTEVPRPLYPSNVMITSLDLKDKQRESRLLKSR
ncbi:50S ribosomal protein L24 [Methanohalophilus halophilus]|uniref:Large ribosomal subunit protein uL24 n=1 Tax=Methanohalophilus halophilus TaxID=2177 RepID=A0A1L3Q2Z8_9EURY|nr:50S ribosomal protein L24 [Methanohalophilus halophilus]APH39238.1 50S ribosomal protein L24 [Methanohalophilus halophilus]RNI09699.1 50S ribosomal protein L24 [Methanohalophilus halophilus]SDW53414.1 LSU ribosomal protein L24P [Methanohalophilus halophilus]